MNNKSQIFLLGDLVGENFTPADEAMLQALHSRSTKLVTEHIDKWKKSGSNSFMEKFYIGYGHDSVGDQGHITIFLHNVSMLAAKVFQDSPLYAGTECSSRYLNFKDMGCYLPEALDSKLVKIQDDLIDIYDTVKESKYKELTAKCPCPDNTKPEVWDKTLKAKAFDVARGFLPYGSKTNLSIHMSLREFKKRYLELVNHPVSEVRNLNSKIFILLKNAYPSSFTLREPLPAVTEWENDLKVIFNYGDPKIHKDLTLTGNLPIIDQRFKTIATERPKFGRLPKIFKSFGTISLDYQLDLGSFRDIQRHRNGYCPLPLPTADNKLHDWYIDNLPEELKEEVVNKIERILTYIINEDLNPFSAQYLLPLAILVPVHLTYDLIQMVYVLELRSSQMVHSTLRSFIQVIGNFMKKEYPELTIYMDDRPDILSDKRGTQDIIEK